MTEPDARPAEPPTAARPRARGADLAAEFDAFYKDARGRLLLQTYALTGDLGVARSAVRDAFVVGWHHWRKHSRTEEDPEGTVRPLAWRIAQRRSTTRPWHKEKDLDPDNRRTLDALNGLTVTQRRALLLTQLAAISMPEMAREVGLPLEAAERELQTGAAQFATARSTTAAAIPHHLAGLSAVTAAVRWPRVTIIRRAGSARRRAHTLVGAVAAVGVLFGSGIAVTDAAGIRPTLDRDPVTPPASTAPVTPGPELSLPDTSLLPADTVRSGLSGAGWRESRTSDNSTGNGLVLPCQGQRYADPHGVAAWMRLFRDGRREDATRNLTQLAEASASLSTARATFRRARRWAAGCRTAGTQLYSTAADERIGDDAAIFVLRSTMPEATYVLGVARTGLFTTALGLQTDVLPRRADRQGLANLLAEAVNRLCVLPDAGECARTPAGLVDVPVFPTGSEPAMLSTIDLPPLGSTDEPWVGTPAREITGMSTDLSILGCDIAGFGEAVEGRRVRAPLVRTFVKVESDLPASFGLTQAIASLPAPDAEALVARVRDEIDRCPDEDAGAGTDVRLLDAEDEGDRAFSAWHLVTRLPREQTIQYDVAIIRAGTSVSQLLFVSAPAARMADTDVVALTRRALERLAQLPAYKKID